MRNILDIINFTKLKMVGNNGAKRIFYKISLAYLSLMVFLSVGSVSAQDSLNLHWLGGCVGTTGREVAHAMIDNSHYLFVLLEGSLLVLDVDDPTNPQKVAEVGNPGQPGDGLISVVDTLLYLALGPFGLWIYNVANPYAPVRIGAYDTGRASGVAVSGNYAYIADFDSGLVILDISQPSTPQKVSSLRLESVGGFFIPVDLAVQDTFAYVGGVWGFHIVNIANPKAPFQVGSWNPHGTFDFVVGVAVQGNFAYLANYKLGFWVVDISNPQAPVSVDKISGIGEGIDVVVDSNYAYYAGSEYGIAIIDISNPYDIFIKGSLDTPYLAQGIDVYGSNVYVADGDSILMVDISNPSTPILVGAYNNLNYFVRDIAISGNYVYLAYFAEGLRIVDVSNPYFPFEVGSCSIPCMADGVTVANGYAYVGASDSGLRVIDVTNPAAPYEVGHLPLICAGDLVVDSIYAYIADGSDGLAIVDISNPFSPVLVSKYLPLPGSFVWVTDVAKQGNYVYLATNAHGLFIINVSDPYSPYEIGRFATLHEGRAVIATSNYAYLVGSQIFAIDISDPSSPVVLDSVGPALGGIAIYEDYAYIGGGYVPFFVPLCVVDISNPLALNIVGYYDWDHWHITGPSFRVAHAGYTIFVGTDSGLQVFRFTGASGIEEISSKTPKKRLKIYPNPFSTLTKINVGIDHGAESKETTLSTKPLAPSLKIYDATGRLVKSFNPLTSYQSPIIWSGDDDLGRRLPAGVYFCSLDAGAYRETQKIMLLR